MGTIIFLSLGSNLGDRKANLERALQQLHQQGVRIERESSIYETEPIEMLAQPRFLNMVCRAATQLEPVPLLELCRRLERELNPVPKENKGPRHIDIDILFYGQLQVDTPQLQIPHPSWRQRNFVLVPLEEIAPDFRDPVSGVSIGSIRRECPDQGPVVPLDRQSGNL